MAIIDTTSTISTETQLRLFLERLATSYVEDENALERFQEFVNIMQNIDLDTANLNQLFENFITAMINSYESIEDPFFNQMFDIFLDKGVIISQRCINILFEFHYTDQLTFEFLCDFEMNVRSRILGILLNEISMDFILNVPGFSETIPRDFNTYSQEEFTTTTDYNSIALAHLKWLFFNPEL